MIQLFQYHIKLKIGKKVRVFLLTFRRKDLSVAGGQGGCREQAVPARVITEQTTFPGIFFLLLQAMPQHNLTVSNSVTKITQRSLFF